MTIESDTTYFGGLIRRSKELIVGETLDWTVRRGENEYKSSLRVLDPDTLVYLVDPDIGVGGRIEREDINQQQFPEIDNDGVLGKILRKNTQIRWIEDPAHKRAEIKDFLNQQ